MILGTYLATTLVEDTFMAPSNAGALAAWIALLAYTAQIYLDFSGYTDIARGCALLLGFELPENFRYPYAATNIGDYWRRWHTSFSGWLRDYVYVPLGGSRGSRYRTYANLVVTFAVCGLWHGATWGFVTWGLVHGIALAIYKARKDRARARGYDRDAPRPWYALAFGWAATLVFVALARILFKSTEVDQAWSYAVALVGGHADPSIEASAGVIAVTALTFVLNFVGRPCHDAFVRWHERLPDLARPLAWTTIGIVLLTLRPYDVAFTIYFGF